MLNIVDDRLGFHLHEVPVPDEPRVHQRIGGPDLGETRAVRTRHGLHDR